jgi:hypothetical protein
MFGETREQGWIAREESAGIKSRLSNSETVNHPDQSRV